MPHRIAFFAAGGRVAACASAVLCYASQQSFAAEAAPPAAPRATPSNAPLDPILDYFAHWQERVERAQASQPHWMTPMTTVTPRLEQEYRFDLSQQSLENGAKVVNYGGGKGLELIPTESTEVLLNVPNYESRTQVKPATGFNDGNFVTIKQRFLSANEEQGDYVVSGLLAVQAPTGVTAFTNRPAWIVTPSLAGGIGWGDFDIQGTLGYTLPTDNQHEVGTSLITSATLQYRLGEYFWPEFAMNDTQWTSGPRASRNQFLVGPGIVFGRFQIYERVKLSFGVAYQLAVVPERAILSPLTPTYNHAMLLSMRMTF
ncbi:hypothetical protein [Methylocella silvestris]|uniref:Transporter n=1 Tax=Methylocella silvestris TaxID=199596 RepID=A0A2J7TGD1_METSI|nr:hypothetical protein [Methylocella silvestris]PNG25816.1 hypothetical protein CR492_11960 [Methylocella silvestris]